MTRNPLNEYLTTLEHKHEVSIIGAWDRGSRAWGLSDEESDYDVRFVFTQPLSRYPMLTEYITSIDTTGEELSDTLPSTTQTPPSKVELMGWDAKRFLELINENNPSALECLYSPITYETHPILEELADYVRTRFNIIEVFNHYQSLAKKNYYKYLENNLRPTVKKNLFVIRGALYAEYVRQEHEYPSLDFPEFIETAPMSVFKKHGWEKEDIELLIEKKKTGDGDNEIGNPFREQIHDLIQDELKYREHIRDGEEIRADKLDMYMRELVQSRLLVK